MQSIKIYIERDLEGEILACLDMPEIIAVVGPRQSGKTTLLQHIVEGIKDKKVSVIDFEDRDELALFANDIKGFCELYVEGKEYLFIDEFQYAEAGGRNLKYIYDNYPIKIFITGSSATELSIQSIQYLVGRIFVFTLYPLSFAEFLMFVQPNLVKFLKSPECPGLEIVRRINSFYNRHVVFGGYPRIALAKNDEERKLVLKNIFHTYLLKEIRQILGYKQDLELKKLITALALQTGSTCNYNELSVLTGLKYRALRSALDILIKTFVVAPCLPFYTNKRVELTKTPKFYFIDNGFRNMSIQDFRIIDARGDTGALHENFIASELLKKDVPLHFWRTKSKAEVDFIVEKQGQVVPIEVKSKITSSSITRSFRSFLDKYRPGTGIMSSGEYCADQTISGAHILFRPRWATIPFV